MTPPNPLFSNSVTTMTTNSFHLPYLPDLTHYTYHCFLNTSSREKYTHTQTHTHLFFLHIHILAFKAIFSQFNSFLFIPTAFFLEMVKPPREGTASIYYIDNEEQLPTENQFMDSQLNNGISSRAKLKNLPRKFILRKINNNCLS